jgi:hypothetical protein
VFVFGWLAHRAAALFRLSEFSLRLPAVVGALLYFYALGRVCGGRIWALVALTILPIWLNFFNLADVSGLSLGLTALALAFPAAAGPLLGLALAGAPQMGLAPLTAAAGLTYRYGFGGGWSGSWSRLGPSGLFC